MQACQQRSHAGLPVLLCSLQNLRHGTSACDAAAADDRPRACRQELHPTVGTPARPKELLMPVSMC